MTGAELPASRMQTQPKHSERCRQCKLLFATLLQKIDGKRPEQQRDLGLPTRLDDLRGLPLYPTLSAIYAALQRHRGFENFVGRSQLRGTDYFLVTSRTAVEFDESQHFTAPRRLTLTLYPADLRLAFDRKRWMGLCEQLNRHDNTPPFRDEQRAWLDVLRDFSATILGNRPTVRIYASDERWCAIDPSSPESLRAFAAQYLPTMTQSSG